MDTDRLLTTFLDLVRIASPSRHEDGVARYCMEALSAAGCEVRRDDSAKATGSDTGNVIAVLPGTEGAGRIVMDAHMDTMEPCDGIEPIIENGFIRTDGTTVLGGDDKVGIASAIETVRTLSEQGGPHPEVVCLFTTCEEIGLLGAMNAPKDLFVEGEPVLILDSDDAPGTVTIASAYQYHFDLTFHGRGAHAGVAPEKGINAIEMAAAAISGMELGRIDETTTANVGRIEGGGATNAVPDSCRVTGECRAMEMERLDQVRDQIETAAKLSAETFEGRFASEWVKTVDGYAFSERNPLIRLVLDAATRCGLVARATSTCGGTNGNCYVRYGVYPLAIGCGMIDVHSTSERVAIADIESAANHVLTICRMLAER